MNNPTRTGTLPLAGKTLQATAISLGLFSLYIYFFKLQLFHTVYMQSHLEEIGNQAVV